MLQSPGFSALPPAADEMDPELLAFTSYLAARWRTIGTACGIAMLLVLAVSLLLPRKYTATASVLIEAPAGNDPRGSMAVSPVYLESLKTYEHFAMSDSLFAKAMERLGLRSVYPNLTIENMKQRVLEVTKPRDERVLQIKATLPDALKARALAEFIARETVTMNQSIGRASLTELTQGGDAVIGAAKTRLSEAAAARTNALRREPVAELEAQVGSASELKSYISRELSSAETELAAYTSKASGGKQGPAYMDSETAQEAVAATKAQATSLGNQLAKINSELDGKLSVLEYRKHHRELLEKELAVAQQQYETALNHRNEVFESNSFRGERLEVIDPGVVPQKPSSPDVSLNVAVAAGLALIGSVLFLSLTFAHQRRSVLLSLLGNK